MHDERGNIVLSTGPSTQYQFRTLDGAATAGDKFNVFEEEKKQNRLLLNDLN
jgi:translation initiation factor IF-2